MIRILHSVSNMDRAGVETMLMNYYRHVDREQVQFDFLCNKAKPGGYDEEILRLGGRIHRSPGLNPAKYPQYLAYMRQLFRQHPEYRILHAHNGPLSLYALHAAKKSGVPCRILHAHGTRIPLDFKWPLKWYCKSRLAANCNVNWACSTAAARFYFGDKNVAAGNFWVLPNAIEVERFRFSEALRQRLRREQGLENKVVIGHVGRFTAEKNHRFLLEVFARIHQMEPNAVLVLLGEGPLQAAVRQQAEALRVQNAVRLLGNISNANEWYQAFDVFVFPSVWEGLGIVGIEAQAAGLPCLISDSLPDELLATDRAAFLPLQKGAQAWAAAALQMARDAARTDTSEQITAAGYNIRCEAKKLQAHYERLTDAACKGLSR